MRNIIYKIALLLCITYASSSCSSDNDVLIPEDISDITTTSGPGYIHLKWNKPADGNIFYTKIKYYDPLEKKEVVRLSSVDTLRVPNTRAKFGEYTFNLQTFSYTDNANANTHEVKGISGKAPASEVILQRVLSAEDLSTNAPEPTGDGVENLVDGDIKTFFHSAWSENVPNKPHWVQIKLAKEMQIFRLQYAPRNNSNNKPIDFDLLGSMDGENWTLIKNFTKEKDNLPTNGTTEYKSKTIKAQTPFLFLKLSVNETNNGTDYWTMSELRLYDVTVIDPEADNSEFK